MQIQTQIQCFEKLCFKIEFNKNENQKKIPRQIAKKV